MMNSMSLPASSGIRSLQRNRRGPMTRQRSGRNRPHSSRYTRNATHGEADNREIHIESSLGMSNRLSKKIGSRKSYAPMRGYDLSSDSRSYFSDDHSHSPSSLAIFEVPACLRKKPWVWNFFLVSVGVTLYLFFYTMAMSVQHGRNTKMVFDNTPTYSGINSISEEEAKKQSLDRIYGGGTIRGTRSYANIDIGDNDDMVLPTNRRNAKKGYDNLKASLAAMESIGDDHFTPKEDEPVKPPEAQKVEPNNSVHGVSDVENTKIETETVVDQESETKQQLVNNVPENPASEGTQSVSVNTTQNATEGEMLNGGSSSNDTQIMPESSSPLANSNQNETISSPVTISNETSIIKSNVSTNERNTTSTSVVKDENVQNVETVASIIATHTTPITESLPAAAKGHEVGIVSDATTGIVNPIVAPVTTNEVDAIVAVTDAEISSVTPPQGVNQNQVVATAPIVEASTANQAIAIDNISTSPQTQSSVTEQTAPVSPATQQTQIVPDASSNHQIQQDQMNTDTASVEVTTATVKNEATTTTTTTETGTVTTESPPITIQQSQVVSDAAATNQQVQPTQINPAISSVEGTASAVVAADVVKNEATATVTTTETGTESPPIPTQKSQIVPDAAATNQQTQQTQINTSTTSVGGAATDNLKNEAVITTTTSRTTTEIGTTTGAESTIESGSTTGTITEVSVKQ